MQIDYLLSHFYFWYYLSLVFILLTEWTWVIIKVCRTTRSVFALTLLSFTLLLAIGLTYLSVEEYFTGWMGKICESFVALVPIQSWLFAMRYFKSYLITIADANSKFYVIHARVMYAGILVYAAALIYLEW